MIDNIQMHLVNFNYWLVDYAVSTLGITTLYWDMFDVRQFGW